MKNILLVSQFFYPENFKSNDIAFELQTRGYKVDVLTSIPNYPKGKYYKGYGFFKKRIEIINNVKIFRAYQIPRGSKKSNLKISLNYISFAICSSFWSLFLTIFKKYDNIIVHQTSPITQVLPALAYTRIRKTPLYLWVLDLWPEAFLSGSNVNQPFIVNILNWFTKTVYQKSTKILISSKDFKTSILEKGDFENKLIYFPNWSIDFQDVLDYEKYKLPPLPKGFIIMFAGNIGISQDIEAIVDLALEFKDSNYVKFVIIGDGSKKQWLDKQIKGLKLENNIYALGQYPLEYMPFFYEEADAMLLTLGGKYSDLSLYVPAKLQSYMSSGKPVLGMVNGSSNNLIKEANCGYAVKAGNYKEMAKIVKHVIMPDICSFNLLGKNGRNYYENNFTKKQCIDNLCSIINNIE